MKMNPWLLAASIVASVAGSGMVAAQEPIDLRVGQMEYMEKCAACHGADATGDGPLSTTLMTKPTNLKSLRKTHNDRFPLGRVYSIIDGREIVAGHGTQDMPIWGWAFSQEAQKRHLPPHYTGDTEDMVQSRILKLVYYLHSIQD
jgi:mono/diheme cytochrome c family protein